MEDREEVEGDEHLGHSSTSKTKENVDNISELFGKTNL
jgi:hypothetical protein